MDIRQINKFYSSIKSGTTLNEASKNFGLSITEIRGIIEILYLYGKKIEIVATDDGELVIIKKSVKRVQKTLKPAIEDCIETKILVVSDTHFGNNFQQLHLLNQLYEEAYKREISTVLHIGDMVDGDYSAIRKEQARQVFLHGFDDQAGYVVDMYPQINGMDTYFILGSHDETHFKNGQATLGYWIPKCRKDMHYLGQDQVSTTINNIKITMDHPGDGSAYSLSYKPQKRIEELESGNKPKVLFIGHYHKAYSFVYRNVRCSQIPSLCDHTQFQTKKGISNVMGGTFITIYSDEKGNIQYYCPEEIIFTHDDVWEEAGKDMHRVKRLVK